MQSGGHGYSGPGAYNPDGTRVGDPAAAQTPGATQAGLAPPAPQPYVQPQPQPAPLPASAPAPGLSSTAGIGAESCVRIVYAEAAMVRGVEVWPSDDQMRAIVTPNLAHPTPQQLQIFQACLIHWPQVHGELIAYQAASPAEQHVKARAAAQILMGLGLVRLISTCPGMDAIDCTVLSMRPQPVAAPQPMVAEGPPPSWKDERSTSKKRKKPVKAAAPAPAAPTPILPAKPDDVLPGLQSLLRQSNQQMVKIGAKP